MKNDPLLSYRFKIEVEEANGSKQVVAAFSQFSGIQMRMETIQARAGTDPRGVQNYVPVFTSFEPVTLSRGVVEKNPFMNWVYSAAADAFTGPGGGATYKTLIIRALNDTGTGGVSWRMTNVMPIGYSVGGMDSSSSGVLLETLTLAIGGVKREVFPKEQ